MVVFYSYVNVYQRESMKSGLESLWYTNRNMACLWMVNWLSNRNGFANDKSRKLSICQTIKIGFRPRKDGWSVVNIGNIHPSRGMIRIHKECETTEPHSELQIGPWEVRQYEPQKGLQHLTTSYRLPVEAKPVFGCFCCISVSDHQRPKALTLGNSR